MTNEVFATILPKLKEIALNICRDEVTAEDAVSDALLEALELGSEVTEDAIIKILRSRVYTHVFRNKYGKEIPVSFSHADDENNPLPNLVEPLMAIQQADIDQAVIDKSRLIKSNRRGAIYFLSFEDGRALARSFGFKSKPEWDKYMKSDKRHRNLPMHPHLTYKDQFLGYGDWLGFSYFTFEEAMNYVASMLIPYGITTMDAYKAYQAKPKQLPECPDYVYETEWKGWKYFLGTGHGMVKRVKRSSAISYDQFKEFVERELLPKGINGFVKWLRNLDNLPDNVPRHPHFFYADQWEGYGVVFKTGNEAFKAKNWRKYKDAREWVRLNLRIHGIDSISKWNEYLAGRVSEAPALPDDIPRTPYAVYDEYSATDWFGTVRTLVPPNSFWPYSKTKEWMDNNMRLDSTGMYYKWVRGKLPGLPAKPKGIPQRPSIAYKGKGWISWTSFLGNIMLDQDQLREWIYINIGHKVKNSGLYALWLKNDPSMAGLPKRPVNVPYCPPRFYKKEWRGWKQLFQKAKGRRRGLNTKIFSYGEARQYNIKHLVMAGVTTPTHYRRLRPACLPFDPPRYYKKEWQGWIHFLGTDQLQQSSEPAEIYSYEQAREYARQHLKPKGITNGKKYRYCNFLPPFMPAKPEEYYSGEHAERGVWVSWCDFLDSDGNGKFATLEKSSAWVRQNIAHLVTSKPLWRQYVAGGFPDLPALPSWIPKVPDVYYAKKGWDGYNVFFGACKPYERLQQAV